MKIIAVGHFKTFDTEDIDRPHHGMNGILITEILIEFTIAALIAMGAGAKTNAAFQVVQAGSLPLRKLTESIFPENDLPALAWRYLALLFELAVHAGHPS